MRSAASFRGDSPLCSQRAKGTASASVAGWGSRYAHCFSVPVGTAVDAVLVKIDARDDQQVMRLKDRRTLPGQSASPVFHTRAGPVFLSRLLNTSSSLVALYSALCSRLTKIHDGSQERHASSFWYGIENLRRVKSRAEAGSESLSATVEILERFQASRLAPAGLLTTSALDLGSRLCSSHRSLRSLIG